MTESVISLIIPTHQREHALTALLLDLNRQTCGPERFEVIVVDDGSPEPASLYLHRLKLQYAHLAIRTEQGGPARARNRALTQARGPLILFLNDDVRAAPDLVEAHLQTHLRLDSPAAVMGTFCFTEALRQDPFCRLLEDQGFTHTLQLVPERWYDYKSFWTGNLSIEKGALELVGGFDDAFREASHDDLDLGFRLEQGLGLRVWYTDRAQVRHDHQHTPAMWRRRNRMVGRALLQMHCKHGTSQLDAFKSGERFSRSKLLAFQTALAEEVAGCLQLEALLERLLAPAGSTLPAAIEIDGRTFQLPEDQTRLAVLLVARLTEHDQLEGVVSAALTLRDLAD